MSDMHGLELIRPIAWAEVFEIWRADEESRPNWIAVWKERGFSSWEEWRVTTIVAPLDLVSREWRLYRVNDPMRTVPTFRGGPFRTWAERYYNGEEMPTFAEIAKHPDFETGEGVPELMENFPKETTVTGIVTDIGIVIGEGMHRCTAVARAAIVGRAIAGEFFIALADFRGEKISVPTRDTRK